MSIVWLSHLFLLLGFLQFRQEPFVILSWSLHHSLHLLHPGDGIFNLLIQVLFTKQWNLCQKAIMVILLSCGCSQHFFPHTHTHTQPLTQPFIRFLSPNRDVMMIMYFPHSINKGGKAEAVAASPEALQLNSHSEHFLMLFLNYSTVRQWANLLR